MTKTIFKPAWWLLNPHLQTLWPTLCRRRGKLALRRERFDLPDGDFVDLDWVGEGYGPVVIILHGFEGSVASPYAQGMLAAIAERNWRGVFMHFRGCSGEPNRLPNSYHSGDTRDIAIVANSIRVREPQTPMAAIGYSLGGNVLLKWLGETGQNNPLNAAVAVSVPFELHKAVDRITQGFSRFYQWHMLRCVQKRLQQKFHLQSPPFAMPALSTLRTIREFDDKVTAPLHGFSGVHEYYSTASSRQYLNKIAVPTLLLQSKDDPFMTSEVIPLQSELSDQVELEVTERGGHVGFVSGKVPWKAEYWIEKRVPEFLNTFLCGVTKSKD